MTVHTVYKKDWRDTFISAALYYGVFIWGFTESLSLFSLLNFTGILCGWICYDLVLLAFFTYQHKQHSLFKDYTFTFSFPKNWEIYFVSFILVVTFFVAIVYPPNNWDSMTYHLPRIEHWIQNGNLNHYYTSNIRQLVYAPFAEIAILHNRVLSGDDWLMNIVQWFAFLGTIIVISKIAALLELNKKSQLISSLFFATLPMAILQSSSTQTDLVVTFWLVCLAERFLSWKRKKNIRLSIEIGIALGLAILTKGTAYVIAFPFVVAFAIVCIKHYKKHLIGGFCAAAICLMLNMPHYIRNYISFKNPIETTGTTSIRPTLKSFAVSLFSNIYINTPVPLPKSLEITDKLENMGTEIYPYGNLIVFSVRKWISSVGGVASFHEDSVKNPFHMLFVIGSFVFILVFLRKRDNKYAYIVLVSWGMFVLCIPWQPWITRLQVPLFALSSPIFAVTVMAIRYKKISSVILFIL
ncbi:MAG: glycosyltransferase family 39 protein, partial [Prevotella sp.]|nr:glycosyltransferase family 39 protein [Prevotella sp.]